MLRTVDQGVLYDLLNINCQVVHKVRAQHGASDGANPICALCRNIIKACTKTAAEPDVVIEFNPNEEEYDANAYLDEMDGYHEDCDDGRYDD